ncbi:hypothetical protein [Serratia fonticola]|uniref:hypothetical protein n=1 Tax=Serratia fonticola TaxID=47917 RepID=UPI00301D0B1A
MRYYRIEITDSNGKRLTDAAGNEFFWDSSTNPAGALNVSLDLPVMAEDVNVGGGMVIIGGLPLSMLSQSVNLWLATITIEAGFKPGLPLASAQPMPGMIVQGQIWNPYGNWEGTQQTLNLVVNPSSSLDDTGKPIALAFDGKRGEKLADVLRRCLTKGYPKKKINIDIHHNLVLAEDMPALPFNKLSDLARMIKDNTPGMLNIPGYSGVQIVTQSGQINVFDSSSQPSDHRVILPQDLIGQPTWNGFNQVSFKTPLRADLRVGDRISLPQNIVDGPASLLALSSAQSFSQQQTQVNFSGQFYVSSMRHIGEYRNPSGTAWVTTFDVVPIPKNTD